MTMKDLLDQIKHDGAEDWLSVVFALEDGAYLASAGFEDEEVVNDLYAYALAMVSGNAEWIA